MSPTNQGNVSMPYPSMNPNTSAVRAQNLDVPAVPRILQHSSGEVVRAQTRVNLIREQLQKCNDRLFGRQPPQPMQGEPASNGRNESDSPHTESLLTAIALLHNDLDQLGYELNRLEAL